MSSSGLNMSRRIRRTPYTDRVEQHGVRGFSVVNHMLLPKAFQPSVEEDYWHLREHVQLWDVSCQRQVQITGPDAARLVQWMTPRNISRARVGQCMYVPLVDDKGGMVNDPVLLKLAEDRFWLSIADSDVLLLAKGLALGAKLDVSVIEPDISILAVQGPKAEDLMARVFGEAVRSIHQRDAKALADFGIDFNVSMIFGGQIKGERCRLFQIYSAGNFIESHNENIYFQIGEAKYGKPVLDRVVTHATTLDEAAKCALISMDSTLRSNVSVGLPLDLLVYQNNSLVVSRFVTIDERNQYFQMIRSSWGQQLKTIFEGIADPVWNAQPESGDNVLSSANRQSAPVRVALPENLSTSDKLDAAPLQSLAQQFTDAQH